MIKEAMQSPFILEKIKKTSWVNREYINQLFLLYRLMNKKRLSAAEGQLYFILRNKYKDEYVELLKEMSPVKYRNYLEEQERLINLSKEEELIQEQRKQIFIEQEKSDYEYWMKIQKRAKLIYQTILKQFYA